MSWNPTCGPRFDRNTAYVPAYSEHPEEIPFSPVHKPLYPTVAPVEDHWGHQPQPSRNRRYRSPWTLLKAWKWEFATWILGSSAFACIIALLIIYQDRSVEDWKSDIRLATMVAALSQVTQSALLFPVSSCIGQLKWHWLRTNRPASDIDKFEEASRGPKGSLMLLPRTRMHLVSVGALATLLLLAFSAFTQQSNTIRARNVEVTGALSNASILRAVQYRRSGWDQYLMPLEKSRPFNTTKQGASQLNPYMYNAIISGILEPSKSLSDVQGNCSAEACTWHNYTTVAVCTKVEDISTSLKIEIRGKGHGESGVIVSGADWKPPAQPATEDSFWLTAPYRDPEDFTGKEAPPITDIYLAYYPPCDDQGKRRKMNDTAPPRLNAANWKAFKASFSLCLHTLSSSYNNTMKTTIVETHRDLKWTSLKVNDTVCPSQQQEGIDFCVGTTDLAQWSNSLSRNWEGAALLQAGADNYYTGQWVPNVVQDIYGDNPTGCDPWLGPNYSFDGFTRRANNIGIAMSNALRKGGNQTISESFVKGSEWYAEQYIVVDFIWLAYPAAIYLAITLFFFATIIKSSKGDEPLWKSSPLVLLHIADRNNGMNTLSRAEKEGKKTQVQLQYTGANWHLQGITEKRAEDSTR